MERKVYRVRGEHRMKAGRGRRLSGARIVGQSFIMLVWVGVFVLGALPVVAAPPSPPDEAVTIERTPPPWWYDPRGSSPPPATPRPDAPPTWWYEVPAMSTSSADGTVFESQGFSNLQTSVSLPSSQSLNAEVIPLHVEVTADGTTPEIIVQVTSEQVPDQAVYAGYEKRPGGAIQNLYGFQQARFIGGVGTDGVAEVTFNYEALTTGWINFTVKIWMAGGIILGPVSRSIYISEVAPGFTALDVDVSMDASHCLNAGAIPLNISVTADSGTAGQGTTPEVIVQVVSEDVPDRAVYADYQKHPDGAVQNLAGFQQARFPGGVGADGVAMITFMYEPLVVGTLHFTVKVWVGGNVLYGPVDHTVYVCEVAPNFTSLDAAVNLPQSQGLNAGVIPLNVRVEADGKTPEIAVHVISEYVPDRAVYVGADKLPEGTVQNLYGFQQARFPGGVGPDGVAEVTFQYESLNVGWVVFEVKIWVGDYLWYGPVRHAIYLWEAGGTSTICPPLIYDFAVAAQEDNYVTFSVDAIGNPTPAYTLDCGSVHADVVEELGCVYHEAGTYVATLTASNVIEDGMASSSGMRYTDSATATVSVQGGPVPPPPPVDAPTFTWSGVVTWTGVLTRLNASGDVVTMDVVWLEPLAIPTGTLPITVTYTTVRASRRTVYDRHGGVTTLPDAGALWRVTADNAGGMTSVEIQAGYVQPGLYLPLVLRR